MSSLRIWAIEFVKKSLLEVQEYFRLCFAVVRATFSRPFYPRDLFEQIDVIGLGSLTVVLLTGFFTGAVMVLQSGMTLDMFGARPFVGRLISASMVKELGPVLTALMLAGRVGSGIAAELGSMVVTEQISALRALGTDPIRKLVVPRVLPASSCARSSRRSPTPWHARRWIIASRSRVSSGVYWHSVVEGLFIQDVYMGITALPRRGDRDHRVPCRPADLGRHVGVGRRRPMPWSPPRLRVIVDFFVTRLLLSIFF
jgi:phospholipid/cholesterol/gamma-HCH transport system permease protein